MPSSHNSLLELLELFIPCNSVLASRTEQQRYLWEQFLFCVQPDAIESTFTFLQISSTCLCNKFIPTTYLATPARLTHLAVACMHDIYFTYNSFMHNSFLMSLICTHVQRISWFSWHVHILTYSFLEGALYKLMNLHFPLTSSVAEWWKFSHMTMSSSGCNSPQIPVLLLKSGMDCNGWEIALHLVNTLKPTTKGFQVELIWDSKTSEGKLQLGIFCFPALPLQKQTQAWEMFM